MLKLLHAIARVVGRLAFGALAGFGPAALSAQTLTNVTVRVMAANLTSGTQQLYETPGINIFKGLKPDIVAIQEFNYASKPSTPAQIRTLVDAAFGTSFHYSRETDASYSIPNGIISRYPVLASGSWEDHDAGVNDRGFAWAQIDLPGTNELHVVSVHLKASSGDSARRAAEAAELKALITTNLPDNSWFIVAGDFNLHNETEAALSTFKTFLRDHPVPTDAVSGGDADTSADRTKRYDRVLVSFALTNSLTNVVIGAHSFPNGLVFDSAIYTPLGDVAPVAVTDSHVNGMQHMAVVKDLCITYALTNPASPPTLTAQPQDRTINQAATATFSVTATGTPPLHYQWRFNGTNLAGATASVFTRSNVQPPDTGAYSVVVSNAAGVASSSNALLRLLVPAPILQAVPGALRWTGLSNLSYTVQSRTNLTAGAWQVADQVSSATGALSFALAETNAPQKFFRVVYP